MARRLLRRCGTGGSTAVGACVQPPRLLRQKIGEGPGAKTQDRKTVCFVLCRHSDSCLRVWRTSFGKRVNFGNSVLSVKCLAREAGTTSNAGLGSLSLRRDTEPKSVANCPGRRQRPTIARNSSQPMSIAAENARPEWANSTLKFRPSKSVFFCHDVKHGNTCARPI